MGVNFYPVVFGWDIEKTPGKNFSQVKLWFSCFSWSFFYDPSSGFRLVVFSCSFLLVEMILELMDLGVELSSKRLVVIHVRPSVRESGASVSCNI